MQMVGGIHFGPLQSRCMHSKLTVSFVQEINYFGLLRVTKKAMQLMRELKTGGLIQQVTSVGATSGVPLFSTYCASKWAIEGFTEAISQEVKPEWGIKFTIIEPGGFRTQWAGDKYVFTSGTTRRLAQFGTDFESTSSMIFASEKNPAYDHLDGQKVLKARQGTQVGDAVKGANAMYNLAIMEDPPLRVCLGSDAYNVSLLVWAHL